MRRIQQLAAAVVLSGWMALLFLAVLAVRILLLQADAMSCGLFGGSVPLNS